MIALMTTALVLTLAGVEPAAAGARGEALVTMPQDEAGLPARLEWGYADAVLSGDTAYLSGVVAMTEPSEPTPESAFRRAFRVISERLEAVGCGWDDVVEMTSYHTEITAQMPDFLAVKRDFVRPPYPAWTAVGITRLIPDNGVAEITVVAKSCRPPSTP